MKFEIKGRWSGAVLFSLECESWKVCVEAAVKSRADLSGADLYGANLSGADLSGADLYGANLSRANLYGANLYGANLSRANLSGANLYGANLSHADLYGANLSHADLYGVKLKDLKNAALVLARTQITPQEGAFVGWKKLRDDVIARLVIPHDALRFNSYGSRKCRASKVVVHEMWQYGEAFTSTAYDKHTGKTAYITGAEVLPDSFDEDKQVECSHGIHFFMTKEEAEAW